MILSGVGIEILLKKIEKDAFASLIDYRYKTRILLAQKETSNLETAIKKFTTYIKKDYSKEEQEKIIKEFLKSFKGVVIVYKGKLIKGSFSKDGFYIMDYIPELDIFIGKEVKYSQIYSIKDFFSEVSENLKSEILRYIWGYFAVIILIYFMFVLIYKKKLNELDKHIEKIHTRSIRDSLTGVYNRSALEHLIEEIGNKTLIILDLDNFKYVNDVFGHKIGDMVLIEFSNLLKKFFEEDIIVRWGGDEFLIFTDKSPKEIERRIEKINKIVKEMQDKFDSKKLKKLAVSAGICDKKDLPYEEKFKNADLALYKVKKSGKGRVLKYSDLDYVRIEKE